MSLREPKNLDELLNYRLLRLYAQSGAPVLRLLEGRWGISRREWRLLALLALHGELSPSALAEMAHLDRPRATRGVQVLIEKRLARRRVEPGDARRAQVALTATGRKLYAELFPQIAAINTQMLHVLDERTLRVVDDALRRLTEHATKVNQATLRDLHADRRLGGARRPRGWAALDDA